MGVTYEKAGVSINKGEEFAGSLKRIFPFGSAGGVSAFGSLFPLKGELGKNVKDPVLVSSTDGVGTKLILAQKFGIHDSVCIDMVAMNVNDVVALGAKPLFFLDYIACGRLDSGILSGLMKGLKKGLNQAGCVLLGGETAEMPDMYRPGEYDLAGFCVGMADRKKLIDGRRISRGDIVLGLCSSGVHSNGFSLIRKVLNENDLKDNLTALLKPTRIYVRPVLSVLDRFNRGGRFQVKGIAHVTGGAFYKKAVKILPPGLGMVINKKSWRVPAVFKLIQERGGIDEVEMYTVFNMGIGMIAVVSPGSAGKIADAFSKFCPVRVIGEIVRAKEKIYFS